MTNSRRKLIASIIILIEIFALSLSTFGLYIRFAGAGNPTGSIYLLVGGVVALAGSIVMSSISRKRTS